MLPNRGLEVTQEWTLLLRYKINFVKSRSYMIHWHIHFLLAPDTWPFFYCAFERSVRTLLISIAVRKVVDLPYPEITVQKTGYTLSDILRVYASRIPLAE